MAHSRQLRCLPESEAVSFPPPVLVHEDGTKLGEFGGRVVERREDDRAFRDGEREEGDVVFERLFEPAAELLGADESGGAREDPDRRFGDGYAGQHHRVEAT
jgi:hypothetical protein